MISGYRSVVRAFAQQMLVKLNLNAHKGHWQDLDLNETLIKLYKEVGELHVEIYEFLKDPNQEPFFLIREAADVANFALIAASIALRSRGMELEENSLDDPI